MHPGQYRAGRTSRCGSRWPRSRASMRPSAPGAHRAVPARPSGRRECPRGGIDVLRGDAQPHRAAHRAASIERDGQHRAGKSGGVGAGVCGPGRRHAGDAAHRVAAQRGSSRRNRRAQAESRETRPHTGLDAQAIPLMEKSRWRYDQRVSAVARAKLCAARSSADTTTGPCAINPSSDCSLSRSE